MTPPPALFFPVRADRMLDGADATAQRDIRLRLSYEEIATLGAVDVVQASMALGGSVDDAVELVRAMWLCQESPDRPGGFVDARKL